MEWAKLIDERPDSKNEPVLRNSGVPVCAVLKELAGGMTDEQIKSAHAGLTVEDIRAVQAFAASQIPLATAKTIDKLDREFFEFKTQLNQTRNSAGLIAVVILALLGIINWRTIPQVVNEKLASGVGAQLNEQLARAKATNDTIDMIRQRLSQGPAITHAQVGIVKMKTISSGSWGNGTGWTEYAYFDPPFNEAPTVMVVPTYLPQQLVGKVSTYASNIQPWGCNICFQASGGANLDDGQANGQAFFIAVPGVNAQPRPTK